MTQLTSSDVQAAQVGSAGCEVSTDRPEDELMDLAHILGERFVQRWDLFPQQRDDGRYICLRERLSHDHIVAHLKGEITLGTYLLNEVSQSRCLVFEADNETDWRRLRALAKALAEIETTCYLERSRRGGHLWLFFAGPLPGELIRRFGQGLMLHFGLGGIELFPKQDWLATGPGSLIRLPFGVHRKSGRRYGFYRTDGQPLASTLREQIRLFEGVDTVSPELVMHFSELAPAELHKTPYRAGMDGEVSEMEAGIPLYERVKQAIPVREFVGLFVSLSPSGTGLCLFHDDHMESFSVHSASNSWKCFACGKSGSIIDFQMYYRDRDFKTAVSQLAEMLL